MMTGDRKKFGFGVLVAASMLLLAACGSPQVPASVTLLGEHQPVTVDVVPAKAGNISVMTSYAAIVEATDLVDVVPLATGRVEKLAVSVGSEVKQGQVIAELSHGALDAQLQQAQAEFAATKAAVKPDALKAQARLDAVQAVLDQLLNPAASDIRKAESLLAKAQSNLEKSQAKSVAVTAQKDLEAAQTKLDQLLDPLAVTLQAGQSALVAAQSNLDSSKTKLNQLLDPSERDLEASEGAVAIAQSKLDSAETKRSQLMNPPAPVLAAAQEAVADARTQLAAAQAELNQAISGQTSVSWQLLLGARTALQSNKAILENPTLNVGLTSEEIVDAEEAVAANEEQISVLLALISSAPLLVIDDKFNTSSLIPKDIRAGLWKESKAELALETASAKLQELQDPSQETIDLVQSDVTIADSGLRTAQGRHAEFTSPSDRTVALAQDQVDITQAISDSAQETFNELQKPSQSVISLAQKNVAAAEAQANYEINSAQAALESASTQLGDPKTPRLAQLAAAKAAVVAAEQTLILTQKSNAQHRIQAAQAKVNQVEQQLAETRVLAPFDGVVTKIWLSIGAIASPRPMIPVATVASKDVLVSLRVEETSVGFFKEGQKVRFTSPGLPVQQLELEVDLVAPTGEKEAHTFLVQLSPSVPVPGLKPGLSGQVSISSEREGVLLVPNKAVRRVGSRFSLFIVRDGQARSVEVDAGLEDDKNIEILGGIQPGDLVVVSGQNLLNGETEVTVTGN